MKEGLELLAPVGSFESLKAAVQKGADAVYLGGKEFSARANANNFDRDELKEAVYYAHIRDCKVFVTVNTLIKEDEKVDFIEYIRYLYEINVDAVILQDIGMAKTIKNILSDFELHASTQMAAHSLYDVKYLESIGFKRVVLARELSIEEIDYICNNCKADIEVFVHGALCVSYSGQCLMSSVLGNRSGNRGRCAQPCRQKYRMYDSKNDNYVSTKGEYLLSPRDLNTIENIGRVIDANVMSLKIEGRMKRPEYVASVIGAYREAMDNHMHFKNNNVNESKIDELYTIFNRKFTSGYIFNDVGEDVMNNSKPNNRGLYVGKVLSYNSKKKRLKIELIKPLRKGDGLNIGGGTIGRIIKKNGIFESADSGEIVEIDFIGNVKPGTEIFKTSDGRLMDFLKKSFTEDKELIKIPIFAKFTLKIDESAVLKIWDTRGNVVTVHGEKKSEKAIKVALSVEKCKEQLSKLGDTHYYFESIEIELEEGLSLPISELNNIRRKSIELLNKYRSINKRVGYDFLNDESVLKNVKFDRKRDASIKNENYKLNVSCQSLEQLKKVLEYDVDNIYYRDIYTLNEAIEISKKFNRKISYYMPRIIRTFEKNIYDMIENNKDFYSTNLESVRVSNYGEMLKISSILPDVIIDVSSWMNIINLDALNHYIDKGVDTICLSQECSLNQIKEMKINKPNYSGIEYLVYGQVEMMLSEYCPMGVLTKNCKKDKRDAQCNKSDYFLESTDNRRFRLSQDRFCRTTIYSDEVVDLIEDIDLLAKNGVDNFEISLYFESDEEVEKILNKANSIILGKECNNIINKNYSKGHLFREID